MEPIVAYGLWYVDSLDQFSSTMAGADVRPNGAPTKRSGGAKKTSVCLHTAGETTHLDATKQPVSGHVYQLRVLLRLTILIIWRRPLVAGNKQCRTDR